MHSFSKFQAIEREPLADCSANGFLIEKLLHHGCSIQSHANLQQGQAVGVAVISEVAVAVVAVVAFFVLKKKK